MKVVIQRVKHASVVIEGKVHASIEQGLLLLLGITHDDEQNDIDWLVNKIAKLRIFSDDEGKMNQSIQDVKGQTMIISQFTLFASTKKGNRPSYINAAKPQVAKELYENFINTWKDKVLSKTATGVFAADMKVTLENDGPVTIIMDTKNKE